MWYDVICKHVIGLLSTEGRPRKKWSLAFRGRTKHQEQGDPAAGCQESPTLLEQLLLRIAKPPPPNTTTAHSSATHSPLYHRHYSHLQNEKEHLRSCLSRPPSEQRAPHAPTSLLSSPTERHRRQPRKTIATTGQTTATFAARTPNNIYLASAITTGPPFFPSGLVIDRRLPHNTPPIPPKCLPQSSNAAASPSPKG
jgi:hypothetical protein